MLREMVCTVGRLLIIIGIWIDDNLMGFLTVVITRGIVKGFPLYSALLLDYDLCIC